MIKTFVIAAVTLFVLGVVLGLGAWAVANVWPVLLLVAVGGGGAAYYIRRKRVQNTV